MASYPCYSGNNRGCNYVYLTVNNRDVEVPVRDADEVAPLTSAQKPMTLYGCSSIPSSRVRDYPVDQCLPTLREETFLHGKNAFPSCLYPKTDKASLHEHDNNACSKCLYPKQVKAKLDVRPVERPPESMETGEKVNRTTRNIRVSLMPSPDSPDHISFKLLHDEPEPESIEMPPGLMPAPPPTEEAVQVNLLPVEDSHKAQSKDHCRPCLIVSSVIMRTLGIGANAGLEMAHQFGVYSFRVLNDGLHVYGPIVAKAAVSSYNGLRKGCKIFLEKSAPIASRAKNVTLACIRKTGEECVQEGRKQRIACIPCFFSNDDAEDELGYFEEFQRPGPDRPSHYDNELAWRDTLRVYPRPHEEYDPNPDSEVLESMAENPPDKPTPELSAVLQDHPNYLQKTERTSPHDDRRLGTRNYDNVSCIVPFKVADSGYYRDSMSPNRQMFSPSPSPVRNKHRRYFTGQGLGALVWPQPDIRSFSHPLRYHELITNLAVRPETKNFRDLIQQPPLEDECIWRSTLRAYFQKHRAQVRPENVLLGKQVFPMKRSSRKDHSENLQPGNFSSLSYSGRQPRDQHSKCQHLLQISHGDKVLPNRGKNKKQLGHSNLTHLKYDECGSVTKSHDHYHKLMKSRGNSPTYSRMEVGHFRQPNPIHSSKLNQKILPASKAHYGHGKKRPHSPQSDSMEELPHSPEAVEKSDNTSRAHPHGKHQKLEVLSAPDPLIQAKFSKRPIRISKHELSSDRSEVGYPAESRQSERSLKPNSPQRPQLTPSTWKPPFHIPKICRTDRDVRSAHIPFSGKHLQSLPSYPIKSFDHQIPSDFRLKSPDPYLRGREQFPISTKYYRRILSQPSENCHERTWRSPRNEDAGVSRSASMRQHSADDSKRKGRVFCKRPRSRAPFKSYTQGIDSEAKSKLSPFLYGLSFRRFSSPSKRPRKQSAKDEDKVHPSIRSSFWDLPLKGKFRFSIFKQSRPAATPHSRGPPRRKIHDHSNMGEISYGKKRRNLAKGRPLAENIPRLELSLSKKDPHGIQPLSQRAYRQHGTVLGKKWVDGSESNPKESLSSAGWDKRTKTDSNLLKLPKKNAPQVSPSSCFFFFYPKIKRVNGRRSSSPTTRANSEVTPSNPGKKLNSPITRAAMQRSASSQCLPSSQSPSKLSRKKVQFENPITSNHGDDPYAKDEKKPSDAQKKHKVQISPNVDSELTSKHGNKSSQHQKKHKGQISDMHSKPTSKPKPDGGATKRNYADNVASAAVSRSPGSTDVKPASTTPNTSKSTYLQTSEMMINRGDEDGDDSSADNPYQRNPEITKLLTAYRTALIKEARKEVKPSYTGHQESRAVQDSGKKLRSKKDASQQSSNFKKPKLPPPSESFQDVKQQTPDSSSMEISNFDGAVQASFVRPTLADSLEEDVGSFELHDEQSRDVCHTGGSEDESIALENDGQKTDVDHTGESEDESIALENHDEQKLDHAREGKGALENHRPLLPTQIDKHEPEDETHFSSPVGMTSRQADHSFDYESNQSTKDGESLQSLDQPKPLYGQQDWGHMHEAHDQGEKSPEMPELVEQIPLSSKDVYEPRVLDVQIVTDEEPIFQSDEYKEQGHEKEDEGHMSIVSEDEERQFVSHLDDAKHKTPRELGNQSPALVISETHQELHDLPVEGSKLTSKLLKYEESQSTGQFSSTSASPSFETDYRGSEERGEFSQTRKEDEDENNMEGDGERETTEHHLLQSRLNATDEFDSSKKYGTWGTLETPHQQRPQVDDEDHKDQMQDGIFSSLLSSQLLLGDIEVHDDRLPHGKDGRQFESNLDRSPVEDYSEISKLENELLVSSHNANPGRFEQEDFRIEKHQEKLDIQYPELEPDIFEDEEDDRQSSVPSGVQRSIIELDEATRSAMIDENFSKLNFSEKLAAWETLARSYEPPANQKASSDEMVTIVEVASEQDQSSPESSQVGGLDLANSSRKQDSERTTLDNEDGFAGLQSVEETPELRQRYATEEASPFEFATNDQSVRISEENLSKNLFELTSIIEGDRHKKEERHAWEVLSGAEQELYGDTRAVDDVIGFEPGSDAVDVDETEEKYFSSSLQLEISVSSQSVSESYDTASERGLANTTELELGVNQSRSALQSGSASSSPSPSDGKNFAAPARSRRSVFVRPALKKSLIGSEQTFSALEQARNNYDSTIQPISSSSRGSSSQGSSDMTSTPTARTRRSLFIRPVLKKSLVQDADTAQMFAELQSEKNYQPDQLPSAGIEGDTNSKQFTNIAEEVIRRSSRFEALGESSDGRDSERTPKRKSLFVRPILKNSLVVSAETERTFSRLRSEQSEDEVRFDAKDDERERGYQSESFLDDSRSESRSPSPSTSLDGSFISPAGSRKRKSLFTRPLLKQSLVATSETENLLSRLQAEQNQDTRSEEGFDPREEAQQNRDTRSEEGFVTGEEATISGSTVFEGIIGSDSSNSSQGSDGGISRFARPRRSLFTRPLLKQSLVATSETEQLFSRLKAEQNQDTTSEEQFVTRDAVEQNQETRSEGLVTREEATIGGSTVFEGIIGSDSSSSSQGSDRRISRFARPRRSLFTRPLLKQSLVATSDTEQLFSRLQAEQNQDTRSEEQFVTRYAVEQSQETRSEEGFVTGEEATPNPPNILQGSDRRILRSRSRLGPTRGSLFIRPLLKQSLVATSETEKLFSRLQAEQNEDTRSEEGLDTREETTARRSTNFEGTIGSNAPNSSQGSDRRISRLGRPGGSIFTRPLLKQSLVATSETENLFSQLQAEQNEDTRSEEGFVIREEGGIRRSASFEGIIGSNAPNSSQGSDRRISRLGRPRRSIFTRPLLKQSLVATSETENLFSQLQAEQNEDTRSEEGFVIREEGGIRRSASFEGIIGSNAPNSSQGSDRRVSRLGRPRGSLITRPLLKQSLVASSDTEKVFAELQSQQNEIDERLSNKEDTGNEEDTGEREGVGRAASFEDLTRESDGVSMPPRGPRGSLFVRPLLKRSLIGTLEPNEEDGVGLSGSSSLKDGSESGASSQSSEGTSNLSPDQSEGSYGRSPGSRRSALKRSLLVPSDTQQIFVEQAIRKRVKFDPSFKEDASR